MKQITKLVQQIGNGGHIYLPKEMVGQKVIINLVEKTIPEIEKEIMNILDPYLKHIMGIYLYGSYTRNEQTPESDIDILVITDGKVKIKKRINEYEIISISPEELEKSINHAAVLILPILKEAKPILNSQLIEKYKKEKISKKNTKWYIETTETALNVVKYWAENIQNITPTNLKDLASNTYILILRLRGLQLIKSLIKNKPHSNKELLNYLGEKGFSTQKTKEIYRMYREIRDKKQISKNSIDSKDMVLLYNIINKYYKETKKIWAKLR